MNKFHSIEAATLLVVTAGLLISCTSFTPKETEETSRKISLQQILKLFNQNNFEQLARYLGATESIKPPPLTLRMNGPILSSYGKIDQVTMSSFRNGAPQDISLSFSRENCIDFMKITSHAGAKRSELSVADSIGEHAYIKKNGTAVAFSSFENNTKCLNSIHLKNN